MTTGKENFRKRCKEVRLGMSREEVEKKSRIICRKLLEDAELTNIKNLSIYKPMARLNEVDTSFFLSEFHTKYPRVKVSFMAPLKIEAPPSEKFDLILVPALAFDNQNYRLGWGGGWYDRFLTTQPQALKIGLCFQNGFAEAGLPREAHDIRLDKIITEV